MEVEIFGSKYDIKGDADPSHIGALAEYVDKKMREVPKNTPTVSSMKVAILAALNIADDLFMLREEYKSKIVSINKRSDTILKIIEREFG